MTNERAALIARLQVAQNTIKAPIDIMTITGFMTTIEALEKHVTYYEARATADPAGKDA